MNVGFTGTRFGMSAKQFSEVADRLVELYSPGSWFLHGDCVGADMEACIIATRLRYKIWAFPPIIEANRAFCIFEKAEPEADYLVRDRNIVDHADIMLACPKTNYKMRPGTWTSIMYAKKLDKRVEIIYPH